MELATAAKAAVVAFENRDKIGKVLGIAAIVIVSPLILIVVCFLGIMSAFSPDGVLQSAEYFDAADSAVYHSLQEIIEPYYGELKQDMAERREYIIDANTQVYTVMGENGLPILDENGIPMTSTVVPSVTRKINDIPKNVLIAYLMMAEGIDTESADVDEELVKNFLSAISSIKETDQGSDSWLVENEVLSIDEIAALYFPDEYAQTQFKVLCNAYEEYFDVAETIVIADDGSESTEGFLPANLSNVPLYLQYDTAWGMLSYGNGTIKRNGCCPTCLAMVFSYLCQRSVYPDDVVAWSGNRYYVNGSGTSWSIFAPAAEHWGVSCRGIGKNQNAMIEALGSGKLVVASMGPGTFTKGGHFIVLTGITEDGKIKVNDPNDNGTKQHINKSFEVSLILRECKNMWVFER